MLEGRSSSDGLLAFLGKKFSSALMNIGHSSSHLILKFWKKYFMSVAALGEEKFEGERQKERQ